MNDRDQDPTDRDLTDRERELLSSAQADAEPGPDLERRTLAALRADGAFAPSTPRTRLAPWLATAAALVLGFFLGRVMQVERASTNVDTPSGNFLLLLHSRSEELVAVDPDENARRVGEYGSWARGLGAGFVDGAELNTRPEAIERSNGEVRVRAMHEEEQVAGYFLVEAADRAAATEIASACPHLSYGGWVELRELVR